MKRNKLIFLILGALVTISSCKKKPDVVSPAIDLPSNQNPGITERKIYKPKKIYAGTDSLNLELKSSYTFDNLGRVDTTYIYDVPDKNLISYYKSIYKYSGDTIKTDLLFLNKEDNKFYKAGFNFTVFNSEKRPVFVYSYANFYNQIIKGIEGQGLNLTTSYNYSMKDSLRADVKTKGYGTDSSHQQHVFDKNGDIAFTVYRANDTLKYTKYEKREGAFMYHINLSTFSIYNSLSSVHLPVQWYNTFEGVKNYTNITWRYNQEGNPVSATMVSGPGKTYYRFEY